MTEIQSPAPPKPKQSFWQLWNMNFCSFGIQFGWALQTANTSAIYEYLGASPEQVPFLWLAAPVSGLLVQPIVGYLSDRTWTVLGRRRPYFLGGAILASLALLVMPNVPALWIAAASLWVMDLSFNISMEPSRALVADLVPEEQLTRGFAMQGFFVGLGAAIASSTAWFLGNVLELGEVAESAGGVPASVKIAYYVGAIVLLGSVLWTVVSTPESPPSDAQKSQESSFGDWWRSVKNAYLNMPSIMRQLAWVQLFTWIGIFTFFLYFAPAVGHQIFGAAEENSTLYTRGIEWAGICIALYNVVCLVFSLFISAIANRIGRKHTHSLSLLLGGLGLASLLVVRDPRAMLIPISLFGFTWASTLSVPYSLLADNIPDAEMGFFTGIFNTFIVIPQILVALSLGWILDAWLGNNELIAIVGGGVSLAIAAIAMQNVTDPFEAKPTAESLAVNCDRAEN